MLGRNDIGDHRRYPLHAWPEATRSVFGREVKNPCRFLVAAETDHVGIIGIDTQLAVLELASREKSYWRRRP